MSEQIYRPPSNPLPPETLINITWAVGKTPYEIAHQSRRRITYLSMALSVFVLCAILGIQTLYFRSLIWRSRSLANQSLMLTEQGNVAQGFILARNAYLLSENEPFALRAIACSLTARGDAENALQFWQKLTVLPQVERIDRQATVNAALRAGQLSLAEKQLVILSSENDHSAEFYQLAARFKLANHERSDALLNAQYAVDLSPANEDGQLLLAGILLGSSTTHDQGYQKLKEVAGNLTSGGIRALNLLAADPQTSPDSAEWIANAICSHSMANDADMLKALELRLRTQPARHGTLLDEAALKFSVERRESFYQLGQLLISFGQSARLLALLPDETPSYDPNLLILRLDALAAIKRWNEIEEILEEHTFLLPKPLVYIFRARSALETGDDFRAEQFWSRALEAAEGNQRMLKYLNTFTERFQKENIRNYEPSL